VAKKKRQPKISKATKEFVDQFMKSAEWLEEKDPQFKRLTKEEQKSQLDRIAKSIEQKRKTKKNGCGCGMSRNPTEIDWIDLINEINAHAKKAGAASGRGDWKRFRENMREMLAGLEKVKKQYPSYYEKAKKMAETHARRSVGKNHSRKGGKYMRKYRYYKPHAKLGSGVRSATLKKEILASAKRRGYKVYSVGGIIAKAGRKKYGKKKFQALATAGRRKKSHKGKVLRFPYRAKRMSIAANRPRRRTRHYGWIQKEKTGSRRRGAGSLYSHRRFRNSANKPRKKLGLALIALYGVGAYLIYGAMKKS
jgi:hypothetical protein